ncbi:MAG: hypothetical protein RMA76_00590 [Deltaproteobacteria bacterium]
MNPDPNVTRALLKLLVAVKANPNADVDALIAAAAHASGISAEGLRAYAIEHTGLLAGAPREDVVSVAAAALAKGR